MPPNENPGVALLN